jgi:hypothetical protein
MSKRPIYFLLLLMAAACYRNTPDPPYDKSLIVPPDTMVNVLIDLHIMEGVVNTVNFKDSLMKDLTEESFSIVLTRHGMDRKKFEENIRYYSYHAETLDEIYEKVITRLGNMESEIIARKDSSDMEKPETVIDSAALKDSLEGSSLLPAE